MMKLNFIINRLKAMTPLEFTYRLKQSGQKYYEKFSYKHNILADQVIGQPSALFTEIKLDDILKDELIAQAETIYNNQIDIFALRHFNFGEKINYHKDYKTDLKVERNSFGKDIDYRNHQKVGDVKYIWEVNRLLFLLPLAFAYRITGQKKYLGKFEDLLFEWINQNSFMQGINWNSSLEMAIRLINWTFCWHLLSNELSDCRKEEWVKSIYRHCWFIRHNLSWFSSANNHLVGELTGLFIASTALPQFGDSQRWRDFSYRHSVQECCRQNYNDGVNKEQALYYQHYTTEYLLLAALIGERYGQKYPKTVWQMLQKNICFFAAISDVDGKLPGFGDDDGGVAFDLGQRHIGIYRSLLNTGAFLFNREDFLKDDWKRDSKTQLLLNIANIDTTKLPTDTKILSHRFDDGGYYILGTDLGNPAEQKLIFDCGPLGYLSLAAHGHADALSIYFSAGGCPIFIDPGTYAYHTNKKWRDYFRGTTAHNTVCIDGLNQSTIAGNFMWSQKAKAYLIEYQDLIKVKGRHDGYLRLQDKVKHTREINYNEQIDTWQITDQLECKERHDTALYFHLHPDCDLKMRDHKVEISFRNGTCFLEPPADCQVTVFEGDESVPLGWYSPSYDVKASTKTIKMFQEIKGSTTLITEFKVRFKGGKS
jgi:hypothetical protein